MDETTPERNFATQLLVERDSQLDPWGVTIELAFDIAEIMWSRIGEKLDRFEPSPLHRPLDDSHLDDEQLELEREHGVEKLRWVYPTILHELVELEAAGMSR